MTCQWGYIIKNYLVCLKAYICVSEGTICIVISPVYLHVAWVMDRRPAQHVLHLSPSQGGLQQTMTEVSMKDEWMKWLSTLKQWDNTAFPFCLGSHRSENMSFSDWFRHTRYCDMTDPNHTEIIQPPHLYLNPVSDLTVFAVALKWIVQCCNTSLKRREEVELELKEQRLHFRDSGWKKCFSTVIFFNKICHRH